MVWKNTLLLASDAPATALPALSVNVSGSGSDSLIQ